MLNTFPIIPCPPPVRIRCAQETLTPSGDTGRRYAGAFGLDRIAHPG